MSRRISFALALGIVAGLMLGAGSVQAACSIAVSAASAADPHLIDRTNDWDGIVTGNESGTTTAADLYREGVDITRAWLHADAEGDLTANIEVANLSSLQPNAIFYFLWDHIGSNDAKRRRWVSGRLKGYGIAFSYGYMAVNPVTNQNSFRTEGLTTGSIAEGAPGTLTIDIPKGGTTDSGTSNDDWGAPPSGATLAALQAESRILVGSPEPLPPNPSGLRHGYVFVADLSSDGTRICDAIV